MPEPIEELRAKRVFQDQTRDPNADLNDNAVRLNTTMISFMSKFWGYVGTVERQETFQANKLASFASVTAQFQEVTEQEMTFMGNILDKFVFDDELVDGILRCALRQPDPRVIVNNFRFETDQETGEAVLALPDDNTLINDDMNAIIASWAGPNKAEVIPEGRVRRVATETPALAELAAIYSVLRFSEKAVYFDEVARVNRELGQEEIASDFEARAKRLRDGRANIIQEARFTTEEIAPMVAAIEAKTREFVSTTLPSRSRDQAERLFGTSPEGLIVVSEIAPLTEFFLEGRGFTPEFADGIIELWQETRKRLFEPGVDIRETTAFAEGRVTRRRSNTFQLTRMGIIRANQRRAAAKQRILNETLEAGVAEAQPLRVTFIPDADTFDLNFGQTVRLLAVNAPERRTEEGKAARAFVEEFTRDKDIRLEFDPKIGERLVFKRILAVVFVIDPETGVETNLNIELVRRGFAVIDEEGVERAAVARRDPSITFDSLDPDYTSDLRDAFDFRNAEDISLTPTGEPITAEAISQPDIENFQGAIAAEQIAPDDEKTLIAIANDKADKNVIGKSIAIRKLGNFDTKEAAEGLIKVLDDNPIRPFIENAKFSLAKQDGEARKFQQDVVLRVRDNRIQANLIDALALAGDLEVIPQMIRLLRDSDRGVQAAAARALGVFRDAEAVKALQTRARSGSTEAREAATRALGLIGDAEALDTLKRNARRGSAGVIRAAALEAIGRISEQELTPLLEAALNDRVAEVRIGAVLGAQATGNEELIISTSVALLEDKDENVRRAAIRALGRIETDEVAIILTNFIVAEIQKDNAISERARVKFVNPTRVMAQIALARIREEVPSLTTGVTFGTVPFVGGTLYIDGSGSMKEDSDTVRGKTKFQVAMDNAREMVKQMNKTMPLNIVIANTKAGAPDNSVNFAKAVVLATETNKRKALSFLNKAQREVEDAFPFGRGDYWTPIAQVLSDPASPSILMLGDFFATDGAHVRNSTIIENVKIDSRFKPTMIFTDVITGSGVNTSLAIELAEETYGITTATARRRRSSQLPEQAPETFEGQPIEEVLFTPIPPESPPAPTLPDEIERLVRNLGDDEVFIRDFATERLLQLVDISSVEGRDAVISALLGEARKTEGDSGFDREVIERANLILNQTPEFSIPNITRLGNIFGDIQIARDSATRLLGPADQEMRRRIDAILDGTNRERAATRRRLTELEERLRRNFFALIDRAKEFNPNVALRPAITDFAEIRLIPQGVADPVTGTFETIQVESFPMEEFLDDIVFLQEFVRTTQVALEQIRTDGEFDFNTPFIPAELREEIAKTRLFFALNNEEEFVFALGTAIRLVAEKQQKLFDAFSDLRSQITTPAAEEGAEEVVVEEDVLTPVDEFEFPDDDPIVGEPGPTGETGPTTSFVIGPDP